MVSFWWFAFFGFADHFKGEAACDWGGFFELGFDGPTKAVSVSTFYADERAIFFVIAEIFIAEIACGDEAVSARFVERDEQAKFCDARNARIEHGSHTVREVSRN